MASGANKKRLRMSVNHLLSTIRRQGHVHGSSYEELAVHYETHGWFGSYGESLKAVQSAIDVALEEDMLVTYPATYEARGARRGSSCSKCKNFERNNDRSQRMSINHLLKTIRHQQYPNGSSAEQLIDYYFSHDWFASYQDCVDGVLSAIEVALEEEALREHPATFALSHTSNYKVCLGRRSFAESNQDESTSRTSPPAKKRRH
ncbi:uncharacterized protein LOC131953364 [Physella acuta]|uniref:uncharacterized protein LOC131953364 n=1 Tax=Physella acuta TaxID=109671 RepID=UPI0027DBCE3E|nr:uncharacterized protein LOC131953364 [Physella acuta]